jgi:glycosyltransferase involved in cell wall biosynthesis
MPNSKLIFGYKRFLNFSDSPLTYFLPYFLFDKERNSPLKVSLLTHHESNTKRKNDKWNEAINLSDHLIALSQLACDQAIRSGANPSKLSIIRYGVSDIYQPTFNVLLVGAPGKRKGQLFFQEVKDLLKSESSIQWKSASEQGWGLETICDSASNLKLAYDWADLLFVPSDLEGAHTGTLEALYCGVPILTRLTGWAYSELTPYVNVAANQIEAANQIRILAGQKIENFKKRNLELSKNGFSYDAWRKSHINIFGDLLNQDL